MLESTTEETIDDQENLTVNKRWMDEFVSECQAEIGGLKIQLIVAKTDMRTKDAMIQELRSAVEVLTGRISELQDDTSVSKEDDPPE